jgi:hypothetical protein
LVLLLAACGGKANPTTTGTGPHTLAIWHTGNGWTTLTVESTGLAHYAFHATGRDAGTVPDKNADLALDATTLAKFQSDLAACKPCALTKSTRDPVPEEGPQRLHVDIANAQCDVEMLANDWGEGAAAPCRLVLDGLTEEVRTSGH